MNDHLANMYVCVPNECLMPTEVRRGIGWPGPGVMDVYELPYGFWEQNLCVLQKQQTHLTTQPSLQTLNIFKLHLLIWRSMALPARRKQRTIYESWFFSSVGLRDWTQALWEASLLFEPPW